ncbi:hypothetical protein RO07_00615 [Pandoraea pulmonicola]|jgi:hypothetical protein|nr:hypothetical protein RO07_00615 [Pandoraea pulmonicola]
MATLALVSVLLAGCASTVTSQVTAFGDSPGFDGPRTYALTRTAEQQNNQEHATYEQWLRARLAGDGFREQSSASAHYLIGMTYGISQQVMRVAEPVYDPMFAPGPWGPWGPWGRPWGWYGYPYGAPPAYVQRDYPYAVAGLQLRFVDRASGKEVYRVQANTSDAGPSLASAMPFLIDAALKQLPFPSGWTVNVEQTVGQ